VFRPCSPRGSSWPAEYRSDAVELYRLFELGTITKQEMQLRLATKHPQHPLPDERTMRRWAHEDYRHLPEQRRHFFRTQALDPHGVQQRVLGSPPVCQYLPIQMTAPSNVFRIEELFQPIMNYVVVLAMIRTAASVCDRVGKSLN